MAQGQGKVMAFNFSSWLHRKRIESEVRLSGRPVQVHRVVNPYHAVSIHAGPSCFETELEFGGRRFLSHEAPSIPLPTCNRAKCTCRYVHHDDRRRGSDRRHRDVWDRGGLIGRVDDRRTSRGRRATDR